MFIRTTLALLLVLLAAAAWPAAAYERTLSGSASAEQRGFTAGPLVADQLDGGQGSLLLAPELRLGDEAKRSPEVTKWMLAGTSTSHGETG